MKGRTKPDQLVNAQNKNSGFVVQIPEGLYVNCQNNIQFHPLIVPRNLIFFIIDLPSERRRTDAQLLKGPCDVQKYLANSIIGTAACPLNALSTNHLDAGRQRRLGVDFCNGRRLRNPIWL